MRTLTVSIKVDVYDSLWTILQFIKYDIINSSFLMISIFLLKYMNFFVASLKDNKPNFC